MATGDWHCSIVPLCRSLFEKDKLLFSFIVAIEIMSADGFIDRAELRFLLTGGVSIGESKLQNPAPEWMIDKSWTEIINLSDLAEFKGYAEQFPKHLPKYKALYDSKAPHLEEVTQNRSAVYNQNV